MLSAEDWLVMEDTVSRKSAIKESAAAVAFAIGIAWMEPSSKEIAAGSSISMSEESDICSSMMSSRVLCGGG